MTSRDQIISIGRRWIGTPYVHQASLEGVGADCIGLIRGIYRELYGVEPAENINYSRDWGDSNKNEAILAVGDRYFNPVPVDKASPGDIVALRWREGLVAKHVMLLSYDGKAIHAYNKAPVSEIHLSNWWRKKIVAAWSFPGVEEWPL